MVDITKFPFSTSLPKDGSKNLAFFEPPNGIWYPAVDGKPPRFKADRVLLIYTGEPSEVIVHTSNDDGVTIDVVIMESGWVLG